jgi:hypothetical protein
VKGKVWIHAALDSANRGSPSSGITLLNFSGLLIVVSFADISSLGVSWLVA